MSMRKAKTKQPKKTTAKDKPKRAESYPEPVKRKLQWGMCPHTPGNYCDYCLGGA